MRIPHAGWLSGDEPAAGRSLRSHRRTDTASASNHFAFSLHNAGLRGDRPNKRDLELERCLRKAFIQHGPDGESHAAIEQSCSKASMNRAGGVEMPPMGFCGSN